MKGKIILMRIIGIILLILVVSFFLLAFHKVFSSTTEPFCFSPCSSLNGECFCGEEKEIETISYSINQPYAHECIGYIGGMYKVENCYEIKEDKSELKVVFWQKDKMVYANTDNCDLDLLIKEEIEVDYEPREQEPICVEEEINPYADPYYPKSCEEIVKEEYGKEAEEIVCLNCWGDVCWGWDERYCNCFGYDIIKEREIICNETEYSRQCKTIPEEKTKLWEIYFERIPQPNCTRTSINLQELWDGGKCEVLELEESCKIWYKKGEKKNERYGDCYIECVATSPIGQELNCKNICTNLYCKPTTLKCGETIYNLK